VGDSPLSAARFTGSPDILYIFSQGFAFGFTLGFMLPPAFAG
jgi:hypothetical protein